jgi:hypothetical protein
MRKVRTCSKCNLPKVMSEYDKHCNQCKNISIISEGKVINYLLSLGVEVFTPLNPMSHADLIYHDPVASRWLTVQVKTAYSAGNSKIANLCMTTRTGRMAYEPKDAAFFAVVDEDDMYMIPFAMASGKLRVTLSNGRYDSFKVNAKYTDD